MKNFHDITKNRTLPLEKKNQMWESIAHQIDIWESFLAENVRMDEVNRHTVWEAYTPPSPLYPNHKKMVNTKIFATMLVILASIMGTSFAAERSVPGDSLYAFKLGVNENVRWALSIGAEADARWEIAKIERRAHERAVLEARSQTTVKTETQIETQSQASVEKAQRHIVELKSEWKAEAASSVEIGLTNAINAMTSGDTHNNSDVKTSSDTKINLDAEARSDAAVDTASRAAGSVSGSVDAGVNGSVSGNTSNSNRGTVKSDVTSDLDVEGTLDVATGIR